MSDAMDHYNIHKSFNCLEQNKKDYVFYQM